MNVKGGYHASKRGGYVVMHDIAIKCSSFCNFSRLIHLLEKKNIYFFRIDPYVFLLAPLPDNRI